MTALAAFAGFGMGAAVAGWWWGEQLVRAERRALLAEREVARLRHHLVVHHEGRGGH